MIAYLIYTQGSPDEQSVKDFAAELQRRQVEAELVEAGSRRGISLTELYDITNRPAVVLAALDGTEIQTWQGSLPLAADVSYLAHQ